MQAYVAVLRLAIGDLGSVLGRSTWVVVVIGSEWEVPPQLFALRGSMRKSTFS